MSNKDLLRKKLRKQRKSLDPEQPSKKIRSFLEQWDIFQKSHSIMLFAGFDGEPLLLPLLEKHPEKKFLLPRISGKNIEAISVKKNDLLRLNAFGILEPTEKERVLQKEIDLLLVPAVAIDEFGNRLGFGGGFYDRFLEHFCGIKAAVLFDFQKRKTKLIAEKWDVPMDFIVTESGVQKTKKEYNKNNFLFCVV